MRVFISLIIILTIGFIINSVPVKSQQEQQGETGTETGTKEIPKDIFTILMKHKEWVESGEQKGQRADLANIDLSNTNLEKIELSHANLMGANLSDANLMGTNLSNADLMGANLSDADLRGTNLSNANLRRANLSDAKLEETILIGANLNNANLKKTDLRSATIDLADFSNSILTEAKLHWITVPNNVVLTKATLRDANLSWSILSNLNMIGADLSNADLTNATLINTDLTRAILIGAKLIDADLTNANLSNTNLTQADFEGSTLENTNLSGSNLDGSNFEPVNINGLCFLGARGLSKIKFKKTVHAVKMLKISKDSYYWHEVKALTAALRKHRWQTLSLCEKVFQFLIDLPTDSGANPWRSIGFLLLFILLFSFRYMIALWKPHNTDNDNTDNKDGIWIVWMESRIRQDLGAEKPVIVKSSHRRVIVKVALYFSLLSAFSIGWRELNIGNWIARIQQREYTLRATGRVRTVSGIQSLISVYLLAHWALTYFGRPFE